MSKEQVIKKLKEQLEYINEVAKLQNFWNTNNDIIEKITTYYFSFSNQNNYQTNKQHFDNKIKEVINSDTEQIKVKLENLIDDLESSNSTESYIVSPEKPKIPLF